MGGRSVIGALARARQLGFVMVSIGIALAIAITAIVVRSGLTTARSVPVGAQTPLSAPLAMTSAATLLETAVAKDGPGYTFEILQRSTMHAKAGGPQIEIPDPTDPHKSDGFADTYELGALIERGAVTSDGFTMEMRTGPAVGRPVDWTAPYQFGVTTVGGKVFRNDGAGWYPTDDPPGIGLDPKTAARLPSLLRDASGVANAGFSVVGDVQLPTITGSAKVADIPGIVAVDGASFTQLVAPVEFTFDAQGRLAQLHSLARNANLTDYDLLVDTVITFSYPAAATPLPDASPARPASADVVQ
jgi:hypothetical protein